MNFSDYHVKNTHTFNGRDGLGFTCTLYKGKKRIATVVDDGAGGEMQFQFADDNDLQPLKDFVSGLPHLPQEGSIPALPMNIDLFVAALVDDHESEKRLKRLCKTKTLYRLKGDEDGTYRSLLHPWDDKAKKHLHDMYGDDLEEVANERLGK
jgi:hypothetical protein